MSIHKTIQPQGNGHHVNWPRTVFSISSAAFPDGGQIPEKYGCEGEGVNPDFKFEGIPDNTKTIALIAEDPDAPSGTFDHWVVWNIFPGEMILEGAVPGTSGLNGKKQNGYTPPCPPDKQHRYFFRAYALDTTLDLPASSVKEDLKNAMEGHTIATAAIMGLYKKAGQ